MIGEREHFGFSYETSDRNHRPGSSREISISGVTSVNRRLEEAAISCSAAGNDLRSSTYRVVNMLLPCYRVRVDQRPILTPGRNRCRRVAPRHAATLATKRSWIPACIKTVRRNTGLACVTILGRQRTFDGRIQIGVANTTRAHVRPAQRNPDGGRALSHQDTPHSVEP